MELLSGLLNGEISGLPRVKLKRLQFARKPVARYHDRTAKRDYLRHLAKPLE
jgi:hypothetical protein